MNRERWSATYASVIGAQHSTSGLPCQDACVVRFSSDREWFAAVVSDGAGSARYSDQGSRLVADAFANKLIGLTVPLASKAPGAWINDYVIEQVIRTREELRQLANSDRLEDYHCTLVACLVGPSGGFLVHIGDGVIIGGNAQRLATGDVTDLGRNLCISPPENGEYANETFFITEGSWIRHIRITPVGSLDWIMLGTDGGAALAMSSNTTPREEFLCPLVERLSQVDNEPGRRDLLEGVLTGPEADTLTGDDKTLCLICRTDALGSGPFELKSAVPQRPVQSAPQIVGSLLSPLGPGVSHFGVSQPSEAHARTPTSALVSSLRANAREIALGARIGAVMLVLALIIYLMGNLLLPGVEPRAASANPPPPDEALQSDTQLAKPAPAPLDVAPVPPSVETQTSADAEVSQSLPAAGPALPGPSADQPDGDPQ
jgi:hypothetical protein